MARKEICITSLFLISVLGVLPPIPMSEAFSVLTIESTLGTPVIDGVTSPGEWGEWRDLSLYLDQDIYCNPPETLNISLSVLNTAFHLSFAVQIPDQLPGNSTTPGTGIFNPPCHQDTLNFDVYGGGRIVRLSVVVYDVNVIMDPSWIGLMAPFFSLDDPSRPIGNASFSQSRPDGRGTYTFEVMFPLTIQPQVSDNYGNRINYGLRPDTRYGVISLSFSRRGSALDTPPGQMIYSYFYEFPANSSEQQFAIIPAYDPSPTITLALMTTVVVSLILVCLVLAVKRLRHR